MTKSSVNTVAGHPEVWVTGIGLVSSLGEGFEAHDAALRSHAAENVVMDSRFSPYLVHPLAQLDLNKQIPKKSDQRQMEGWQRIGVYAAGLALDDAGLPRGSPLRAHTDVVVAAGSGERDTAVDARILEAAAADGDIAVLGKEVLPAALRPTLFLAQLSNLLAGNISIVHNLTASSRTYMGEEMAGISSIENAWRRIGAGQTQIVLVGGALNAEREDLLLGYELGCNLWAHPFAPVWRRRDAGGGFAPGSAGAFLVLEASGHARARGARPYARIASVASARSSRASGEVGRALEELIRTTCAERPSTPLPVLSGASGVEPVTEAELSVLRARAAVVRAYGSVLGHTVEAHLPLGVALGAMALRRGAFYPPFDDSGVELSMDGALDDVLITSLGHWRGEGAVRLSRISTGEA
ncbi:MAG: beta-ketoacyl-ACP synthase [Hyphomicrobiales bacterium]|nr:MAG: beta-ketoacyl-ACP synthase [Hyphomicrobiales bacterium]